MRTALLLPGVLFATLLAAAPEARAHGGVYRGPRASAPPVSHYLACDCAAVDCPHCSARGLVAQRDVGVRRAVTRTLQRWGDLVQVEARVRFEAAAGSGRFVEGHARVAQAPLFAVTAGAVEIGGPRSSALEARLVPSTQARRDYLWERRRGVDPLLVLRVDVGTVVLRVFPISQGVPTHAVVRGFALSDDLDGRGVRLYRTGERWLAIVPLERVRADEEPDLVDRGGGRALFFLDAASAAARFPGSEAREVPCVPALEAAARDHGIDAVTRHAALVAVPKGGGAPADLTVGAAPTPPAPPAPPAHEPLDPAPPPPAAQRPIASR